MMFASINKNRGVIILFFINCAILRPYKCEFPDSKFVKVVTNENMQVTEALYGLKSPLQCARECASRRLAGHIHITLCDAFDFSEEGVCQLFTAEDVLLPISGRLLHRYIGPTNDAEMFQDVSVGNSSFSIYESTGTMSYFDARAYCIYLGGYLLHIDSLDEYDAIDAIVAETEYWIGANDMETEGLWQCNRHGTPLEPGLWLWWPYEPNNYGGMEDCATIKKDTSTLLMYDAPCQNQRHFLCEKTPLIH